MSVQGALFDHSERRSLGAGAWIELRSGWVDDADALFARVQAALVACLRQQKTA